jgi:hypothetical protein
MYIKRYSRKNLGTIFWIQAGGCVNIVVAVEFVGAVAATHFSIAKFVVRNALKTISTRKFAAIAS